MQISSRMSAGIAFHADGPEKENALSPNFVRRRGTSYRTLSVDRRRLVDLAEVASTMSARYTGDLPLCMECIRRHSLYCILQRMGSQCSWNRLAVMWSDVRRPKISRAAASCSKLIMCDQKAINVSGDIITRRNITHRKYSREVCRCYISLSVSFNSVVYWYITRVLVVTMMLTTLYRPGSILSRSNKQEAK